MRQVAGILPMVLLAVSCAVRPETHAQLSAGPASASPPVSPPPHHAEANPWSNFTRDLLAAHCGKCHRRDLPTAVPGALAVFDLLDDPWYGRLRDDQYDEMLVRVRSLDVPPADLETVVRFVDCARGGSCDSNQP